MLTAAFAVLVVSAGLAGGPTAAERSSGCRFAISPAAGPAELVGEGDAAARASVMTQADSPLAILRADFGGLSLAAGPGTFTRSGRHVLDVRNVSDQVITSARVMVKTGFGPGSGVGSGTKLERPLRPGEQVRLEWNSGTGEGTDGAGREVFVVAFVEQVQTTGCTFMPSQAWPSRDQGSGTDR